MFQLYFVCFCVIVSLHNCAVTSHQLSGLTIELHDKERFCFYEEFEGTSTNILEYKVLKGGNLDVSVTIDSPNGKRMYTANKKREDSITFEVSRGTYMFCFNNDFSTITHKFLYFELRPADPSAALLAHEVEGADVAPKANTRGEEMLETIHRLGTQVMLYQQQYRRNEARGRYAADTLNEHLLWWPMAQSVAILISGLGQLLALKWFFTEKRQSTMRTTSATKDGNIKHVPPTNTLPVRP